MNRYVIAGAVADAREGKSVVVCCQHSRAHLDALANAPGVERVWRTNGRERVDFEGGGYVRLVNTSRDGLRGSSVDVVFLDHDAPVALDRDAELTVISRGGEVVRA